MFGNRVHDLINYTGAISRFAGGANSKVCAPGFPLELRQSWGPCLKEA